MGDGVRKHGPHSERRRFRDEEVRHVKVRQSQFRQSIVVDKANIRSTTCAAITAPGGSSDHKVGIGLT